MNTTTIASLERLEFVQHISEGILTVLPNKGPSGLGLTVRRVFAISGVSEGGIRGDHAHRDCTQVVVCLHGRVTVVVDDGRDSVMVVLEDPAQGLSIPPGLWNRLTFSDPATVLAVFCDRAYEADDYVRDRAEFMKFKGL